MKVISVNVFGSVLRGEVIFECEKEQNKAKLDKLKKALDKEFEGYLL